MYHALLLVSRRQHITEYQLRRSSNRYSQAHRMRSHVTCPHYPSVYTSQANWCTRNKCWLTQHPPLDPIADAQWASGSSHIPNHGRGDNEISHRSNDRKKFLHVVESNRDNYAQCKTTNKFTRNQWYQSTRWKILEPKSVKETKAKARKPLTTVSKDIQGEQTDRRCTITITSKSKTANYMYTHANRGKCGKPILGLFVCEV